MNTQYRKNLKAVLEANKQYTDNKIDDLKWYLGAYDLSISTDSNVGYLKNLPSGTIGLNVNQIGGMSYKYNQLIPTKTVNQSGNGISITSNNDGTYTIVVENATNYLQTTLTSNGNFINGHKYLIVGNRKTSSTNCIEVYINGYTDPTNTNDYISTLTSNETNVYLYVGKDTPNGTYVVKPQVIDLTAIYGAGNEPNDVSTAKASLLSMGINIDEYNSYNTGTIRDAKTTSVVVSGNVYPNEFVSETKNGVTCTKNSDGTLTFNGTTTGYPNFYGGSITLTAGTYYLPTQTSGNIVYYWIGTSINASNIINKQSNAIRSFTLTETTTLYFSIVLVINNTFSNVKVYPLCIKNASSITKSDYIPYAQPITKQIPLAVQQLDGYGYGISSSLFNYVDLISLKFKKYVGSYTFTGNETFSDRGVNQIGLQIYSCDIASFMNYKYPINDNIMTLDNYLGTTDNIALIQSGSDTKGIRLFENSQQQSAKVIYFIGYTLAQIVGIVIYFELATPVATDISQYIDSDFKSFETNGNYTNIEFVNQHNADMPNTIDELVEVAK